MVLENPIVINDDSVSIKRPWFFHNEPLRLETVPDTLHEGGVLENLPLSTMSVGV